MNISTEKSMLKAREIFQKGWNEDYQDGVIKAIAKAIDVYESKIRLLEQDKDQLRAEGVRWLKAREK